VIFLEQAIHAHLKRFQDGFNLFKVRELAKVPRWFTRQSPETGLKRSCPHVIHHGGGQAGGASMKQGPLWRSLREVLGHEALETTDE
jgi:hypothetical protein